MKKLLVILSALLVILSCKKEDYSIENLNGNKITIMGHGGMGDQSTYPINSMESILLCLNSGADGVEFDVQMTLDSVLVAFHDPLLSESTDLEGEINSKTWAEIKGTKYRVTPYLNYEIVTVNSIFNAIKNRSDYRYSLDCKIPLNHSNKASFLEVFANKLEEAMNQYDIKNQVFIESVDSNFLNLLIDKNLQSNLLYSIANYDIAQQYASSKSLYGISMSNENISKEQIAQAHQNNLRVALWGVFDKQENRDAIEKNPDIIQTDKLKYLVKLLK